MNTKDHTGIRRQILIKNIVTPSSSSSDKGDIKEKTLENRPFSDNGQIFRISYKGLANDGINDSDDILALSKGIIFSLLIEPKIDISEVCGHSALLTHSFYLDGKKRYCCSKCAKEE